MPPGSSDDQRPATRAEIAAFEVATRDLMGLALRSIEGVSISLPQVRLLLVLADGPLGSTEAAQELGVVVSTVSRLADRLAVSGHLRRGSRPGNRSVVTLELTDRGRELVHMVSSRRRDELTWLLDQLEPGERAAAASALRALHERLLAHERAGGPADAPL